MKAGTLEIEIVAEIAKLQQDMQQVEKTVGKMSDNVGRKTKAANDNFGRFGKGVAKSSGLAAHHTQNLAFQFQDMFIGLQGGQKPMTVFLQQGSQIAGIMGQAQIGIGGVVKEAVRMTSKFAPLAIVAAGAAYALNEYKEAINDRAGTDAFIQSIGATEDELKELGETGVTVGDMLLGTWDVIARGLWDIIGPAVNDTKQSFSEWFWESDERGRESANNLIGALVGAFNVVKGTWGDLPAVYSDIFVRAVNFGIDGINGLIRASVDGLNSFLKEANSVLPEFAQLGMLDTPQIERMFNENEGAARKHVANVKDIYEASQGIDYVGNFGSNVSDAAIARRNKRLTDGLAELRGDDKAAKAAKANKKALDAEAKAFEQAVKSSTAYAESLEDATGKIGKTAIEIKRMEIAAKAAEAPTDELAQRIREAGRAWEEVTRAQADSDYYDSVIAPMQDELALLGLVGTERQLAALALEETAFKAEMLERGVTNVNAKWEEYLRYNEQIILQGADMERTIARQTDLLNAQLGVLDTARSSLTDLLSGRDTDILGNLTQSIRDLQGARLFDKLFGDVFDELEAELSNSPIAKANREYADSVDTTVAETDRLAAALGGLANTVSNTPVRPGATFDEAFPGRAANDNDVGIKKLSIGDIADKTAAGIVDPLLAGFGDLLGTQFMMGLSGVLKGALSGYIQAGKVGGVLGGLGGLNEQFGADVFGDKLSGMIGKGLDTALGGASTGTAVAGIGKALGLGLSTGGSQIGGAIGSFLPIPGGAIIGSVAGGLFGKLLGGTKRGSATITGIDNDISTRGNSSSRRDAALGLGGGIQDALAQIADALDAQTGAFAVSIGVRKDNFRVDTSGRGITKTKNGAKDFGQDEAAAIAFALMDAIADGAIKGLSAAENRLLKANKDIEAAVQDVLDFRSVFDRLERLKDPIGFELKQFEREFDDLRSLFKRAGASAAEYAQLEELYGLERAKILEQTNNRTLDSLKSLLNDLTVGDNGLSLRTRRANALDEYGDLRSRVQAGDSSAYDDFAETARTLLSIERELFGSTKDYFDRLNEITEITRNRIDGEENVQSLPNQVGDAPLIASAIEIQTGDVVSAINAMNDNIGRQTEVIRQAMGGSSSRFQQFENVF